MASGGNAQGSTRNQVDDDGFQEVRRRGRGQAATSTDGAGGNGSGPPAVAADGRAAGQAPGAGEANRGEDAEVEEEAPPTAEELHRRWHEEQGFVKQLRRQGVQDGHPAMRAACAARDEAERAWRNAKQPAPASVRLGRAQTKLDKAIGLQADARRAIQEEEGRHRERMAGLQAALAECTARVGWRRQQLRAVQLEVGAGGNGAACQSRQQDAIQSVHSTICSVVGPALEAIVEQMDTASPAWTALNGVLGKLSATKDILEGAVPTRGDARNFDIGDDDGDGDLGGEHWADDASEWSESHEVHDWTADGGHGHGYDDDAAQGDHGDQSMGTDDWWDTPGGSHEAGARWRPQGHGKWTRRRGDWADQLEAEEHEAEQGTTQPAASRRRLDGGGGLSGDGDGQRQQPQQLQQQQHTPTALGGPMGGQVAEADAAKQKRLHAERVNHIIQMAVSAGVNPVSASGEDLQLLDPHQLDAWVAENFPAALLC